MKKNKKNKSPITLSRLTQYIFLMVYMFTILFSMFVILLLVIKSEYNLTTQLIVALFSFVGISATVSIAFYFKKSEHENDRKIANAMYEKRLDKAEEMCYKLKAGKIDMAGIIAFKELISESETTIQNYGGFSSLVSEEKTFAVPSPSEIISDITDELVQHSNLRGS